MRVNMKIKLSKSQWERIGRVAGWMKEAQIIPQIPQVEEDPENMRFCDNCGAKDPEYKIMDVGIGSYEFWGSRGRDVRLTVGTACCGGGIVDGMGNERELPDVDEVRGEPNYGEGRD